MRSIVIEDFFVCIGAQKAGTTWLARMLQGHPDLFLTPVKEIHYFDHIRGITEHLSTRKRRSRYRKYHQRMWTKWHQFREHRSQWSWYRDYMKNPINDEWYASLFRHRGSRRFAGEVTPEYAILGREGFEHLKTLAPEARVLFIMRNPVTRAWSQTLHQCRSRGLDALRQSTETITAMVAERRARELSDFAATLDNLAAVFRPDQTLELFYEDMHADRVVALQQVCRFIGIGYEPSMFRHVGRRFNQSQEAALPDGVRNQLRDLYRGQAEAVLRRLGRVPESWTKEFGI
jgi:sulfotransferase family protein